VSEFSEVVGAVAGRRFVGHAFAQLHLRRLFDQ